MRDEAQEGIRPGVAVTGIGMVTAVGGTADATWRALVAGASGVRPARRLEGPRGRPVPAAEVDGLGPPDGLRVPKHGKFMGRSACCGMHAALEAVAASGGALDGIDPYRVTIAVGSGEAGLDVEEFFPALGAAWRDEVSLDFARLGGPASRLVDPYFSLRTLSNGLAALLAIELGVRGESVNFVQGGTASAHALAHAWRALAEGSADVALVVGCDALVNVSPWLAWHGAGILTAADPRDVRGPFDVARAGAVLGEAAAALVLERRDSARRRAARVLGVLARIAAVPDDGPAVASAGSATGPCHRDDAAGGSVAVLAFGDATVAGDAQEASHLRRAFGHDVPVTSLTGAIGYVGAATAAVQAVVALLALRDGCLPPVARCGPVDPALGIEVVAPGPRPLVRAPDAGVSCVSRSRGGDRACVEVRQA